jgi:Peroxiredoxin
MDIFDNIKLKGIDKDGQEKEFVLAELPQPLVLYFYPKDNTPGCTQEACSFRDNFNRLTGKAQVVGVSPDNIESHKKFQKDHGLNFTLLSDPEHILAEKFGVWEEKSMYGKKYMGINRSTFIIKDGLIAKAWKNVKVEGHVDEIIESL